MRTITATYFFQSESDGKKLYQTLEYDDGSTSCDCKGWTRRIASDGSRSCKHTRTVAAGLGEQEAVRFIRGSTCSVRIPITPSVPVPAKPAPKKTATKINEATTRKFDFT